MADSYSFSSSGTLRIYGTREEVRGTYGTTSP
jgi:hypothetical protein